MNANIQSIMAQIKSLSLEEQRMLNKALVANMNALYKSEAAENAMKFRKGDTVQFDAGPRKGGITKIVIDSFSRDLSSIKGTQIGGLRQGCKWTVGANLCTKVTA